MQILEELGTFVVSLALAVALLGVAAVLLYYFNPQQPLDHAKAAFYPLVKPLNATHVWLGVKPSADKVEVVELKYQYRGRWTDVPVARLTADSAVWLNTTDGRPVAVPCFANVTVATRYGTAARSLSFTPVCLHRGSVDVADVTEVFRQLADYASYVANYVLYKSIPAITAYLRFGSMYVGIQDIAPFAFQAVQSAGAPGWQVWPPDYGAVNLLPLEARDIWSGASAEPLEYSEPDWGQRDFCHVPLGERGGGLERLRAPDLDQQRPRLQRHAARRRGNVYGAAGLPHHVHAARRKHGQRHALLQAVYVQHAAVRVSLG
jgi:hypothetical protein